MCEVGEPADAYWRRTRKARKDHKCSECFGQILAGAAYECASGVWDGVPDRFKTCEACVILREHVQAECGDFPAHGCLLESAQEHM